MKIIEILTIVKNKNENIRNQCENHENHENLRNPFDKYKNHENQTNP